MSDHTQTSRGPFSPGIRALLRATLAAQLLAMAVFMLHFDGSPVAKLCWQRSAPSAAVSTSLDWIQELDSSETSPTLAPGTVTRHAAFVWDRALGRALLATALLICVRPSFSIAMLVAAWTLAWALSAALLGGHAFSHLAPAAQAVRWLFPIAAGLVWLETRGGSPAPRRRIAFEWLLRAGIAVTFITHGYEAVRAHPRFIDLLLLSTHSLLGASFSEAGARMGLMAIGLMDMGVGLGILMARARGLALWMAIWGGLTACSRIAALGLLGGGHETLLRAANCTTPLILYLLWRKAGNASPDDEPAYTAPMKKTRAQTALLLMAFVALAWTPLTGRADYETRMTELAGTTPTQWRVIWKEDPRTQATVSWTTAESGSVHTVHWDVQSRDGKLAAYANSTTCQRNGEYTRHQNEKAADKLVEPAWYHHARLTDLPTGTPIHFVMVSDGVASREFHFRTAADDETSFSILSGGDSRSGHDNRCRMNEMMGRLTAERPDLIAFAHGGDYIGSGRIWQQWRRWLSNHELTTAADGRVLPIIPTRGNHDGGPLYNEIFDFKPSDWNCFVTRFNDWVVLITLNSNIPATGTQREFLEKHLKASRPDSAWLLAQYHRPVYPVVKGPGAGRQAWVPLFERYNLDLALESDGHNIKRTVPIRNEKHDPTGVVYVGEGGLGVNQRTPKPDLWYIAAPGMADRGHHVFLLDFTPKTLRSRVLKLEGGVSDDVTLTARDARDGDAK